MQQDATVPQYILDSVYREHHAWLNAWLRKKLGCSFDAADLAQDTFVKVAHQHDLAGIREPRAYLTTIASRLIIDLARKRKIERAYLEALLLVQHEPEQASPEQIQAAVETLNEIASMLEGLPEKVCKAFLLSRLEELSHAEIAEQLGVSVSMVKQYLARAMLHCYQIVYSEGV